MLVPCTTASSVLTVPYAVALLPHVGKLLLRAGKVPAAAGVGDALRTPIPTAGHSRHPRVVPAATHTSLLGAHRQLFVSMSGLSPHQPLAVNQTLREVRPFATQTRRNREAEVAQLTEATSLFGMAQLNLEHGNNLNEALPWLRKSLEIREKVLGPSHPDVAASLRAIATLLNRQGKYEEAETHFRRALDIVEEWEKALGDSHPYVAKGHYSLYYDKRDHAEAQQLCRNALMIEEKAYGPDSPVCATTRHYLAQLLHDDGAFEEAKKEYEMALTIRERAAEDGKHPDIALCLNHLGSLHADMGQLDEAEKLFNRALTIEEAVMKNHPLMSETLNNMAMLYQRRRNYAQAEKMYKQCLQMRSQAFGERHPDTAAIINNMAALYHERGDYKAAEAEYKRARDIWEEKLTRDDLRIASVLKNLSVLYRQEGRISDAEAVESTLQTRWDIKQGSMEYFV